MFKYIADFLAYFLDEYCTKILVYCGILAVAMLIALVSTKYGTNLGYQRGLTDGESLCTTRLARQVKEFESSQTIELPPDPAKLENCKCGSYTTIYYHTSTGCFSVLEYKTSTRILELKRVCPQAAENTLHFGIQDPVGHTGVQGAEK